jgi:hypothetical protein
MHLINKRASSITRVTSRELLTNKQYGKNYYIQTNACTFKLLVNIVTTGIETLLVLEDKFLFACSYLIEK